jgi:hypothetical protein
MKCRACGSGDLFLAVDLGLMPIAEEVLFHETDKSELFDTKMFICNICGLGQLSENVSKERIFNNYPFKTSYSKSMLSHSKSFAESSIKYLNLKKGDWVLEIASNDGYLLKYFKDYGIDVLGVDPAKNIAIYGICDGIPTITDFFGTKLAKEILRVKGYPSLIVANNVMAHVPDIKDFIKGIALLCNDETVVSIENPSIMNIFQKNQFETIYHEHYSYLSCNSIDRLAKAFDLILFAVEKTPMQGGSNRYWLSKTKQPANLTFKNINDEINDGLFNQSIWKNYQNKLNNDVKNFNNKVERLHKIGSIICGYTASSKAVELLNFAKVKKDWISCIADDSFEKQGKYLPGINIPIVSMDQMLRKDPTDIFIFSWNLYDEIFDKLRLAGYNGNIWKWDDK